MKNPVFNNQTQRWSRPERAWIRLPSGNTLDLLNPDPFAWTDRDLAMRLSRTYRWAGESCWPLPLSVAQHSLLVLQLRRERSQAALDPVQELQELLHDAEEALLGFDCVSPLKRALGSPFDDVEQRLNSAIWHRYQLPEWSFHDYAQHKEADHIAAACEAAHCVGWSHDEIRNVLCITADILQADPLAKVYGCPPWEPWDATTAEHRFHDELCRLTALVGATQLVVFP